MSKRATANLPPELASELAAIAAEAGCRVWAVDLQGNTLRVVLDRDDGAVTLAHCTTVSRQLSALLDVSDYGTGRYLLEVSSPGLDRPLYDAADFRRFVDRLLRVTFADPIQGKRTVVGRLTTFEGDQDDGRLTVVLGENRLQIPLADVAQARLEIEF